MELMPLVFDEGVIYLGGGDDVEDVVLGFGYSEGTFVGCCVECGYGDGGEFIGWGDEEDFGGIESGNEEFAIGSYGEVFAPGGKGEGC
ncbi:hypothetical protein DID88_005384 [Monilinia fructigena]|uniref:Uncharacterized protein n=1 Tax=Monilinia fructigena TaxID=38457 RepID=A0A395J0F3_9HELO|nr:hypothetical protein DID88_005384 [Monilinia fructigena]